MRTRFFLFSIALVTMPVMSQLANHVVISEVYGGGGNTGATLKNDFIELYNPTDSIVSVDGWSVQYASAAGSFTQATMLSGAIAPKSFFLVQQSAGTGGTQDLPTPDAVGIISMGGPAGKIALVKNGEYASSTSDPDIVDLVGYGSTANGFEGTGPTPAPGNTLSVERKASSTSTTATLGSGGIEETAGNGYDSNNNATDFVTRAPQPQNSSNPTEPVSASGDVLPPQILSVKALSNTQVEILFNEIVDSVSSSTSTNYTMNKSVLVSAASRDGLNLRRILLTVTTMANDIYSLMIENVADTAGNVMPTPKSFSFSVGILTIGQARAAGPGVNVRVKGSITVGSEFGSPAVIQDSTGGLAVFNTTFSQRAKAGDVWEVAGVLKNFNGLLEIDPLTDSLLISTGNTPPAPLVITSEELTEVNESKLVRINKVKFNVLGSFGPNTVDSSYNVADAGGSFEVRIDRNTNIPNAPIPGDSVNVVGVVSDFFGSYRLMPRSYADIGVTDPVPGQDWTDIAVARNYSLGTPVRVRGIVTFNQTNASINTVFIQDATGGIALFSDSTELLQPGDSVQVHGSIGTFNNLAELISIDTVLTFGSGHPLPAPIVLNVTNASEPFESMLVKFHALRFEEGGTFSGNTTYHLTDGPNTLDVRIPNLSPLITASIPAGAIDAIGVLGQFQSTYQLTPRSTADLVGLPGPQISGAPVVDSVYDNGFRIRWNSVLAGTTKLLYGIDETITDSVENLNETTSHAVALSGLQSGRIYIFKAISANASGVSDAGSSYGITTSSASTGQIKVYFNYSVDTTLGLVERAEGNVDLGAKILSRISAATRSIDLALYSFGDFNASAPDIAGKIADSLIAAKNRGVKVRMVFHDRATTPELNSLITAGISVLKRTVPTLGSGMHNKFWVFDGRDTVNATDDWIVTGSWNVTDEGTYRDGQNAVFIQDRSMAAIYTKEFEEMFGSSTDVANGSNARFGPTKKDDTPHWTMVGGTKVEVYFSPSDRTSSNITRSVGTAQHNVFFGLLTFTRDEIAAEIIARKNAGVVVKGIVDNTNDSGSEFNVLTGAGIDVRSAGHGVVLGQFHHKYGVVDPFQDGSDPMVITGSHNWSTAADSDNDENTVIIHNGAIARMFVEEFAKRYVESGGSGAVVGVEQISESVPNVFSLSSPYPNPFNPSTTLEFTLPQASSVRLTVYDVLGRAVTTLVNESIPAGTYKRTWNASGVASGLYMVVMEAGSTRMVSKAMLVK